VNKKERALARLKEAKQEEEKARLRYGATDYRAREAREWVEEEERLARLAGLALGTDA